MNGQPNDISPTYLLNLPPSCKILRDATPKSFVILDGELKLALPQDITHAFIVELGRGTSTYVCLRLFLL